MKLKKAALVLCRGMISALFLFTSVAHAELNVEINRGVHATVPIAVVPFAGEMPNAPGNQTLSQIISNDLKSSGQFKLVNSGMERPGSVAEINFANFRSTGANEVLVGKVEAVDSSTYRVTVQLASVFSAASADQQNQQQALLLNEVYKVPQGGLRDLGHHISDEVYQKLTGVRGVFSTKIAYIVVKREPEKLPRFALEVADVDGANAHELLVSAQPIMSPSWSPHGARVAYVSFENFVPEIYVQDVRSGHRQLITSYSGINGAPAFSPDGSKLALVLSSNGNPNIYLYDLNSRKLTQLTQGYSIDTEPAWAPDGQSFVFTSGRGGNPQIYRYTLASGKIDRLTFDGNYNAKASYLPNGQGLIVMHRGTDQFGIARQDLMSGRLQVLTQSGRDESPSVAPNGKMVVYAVPINGRGVLAMVSSDGQTKLRFAARDGSIQEPAWSPFLQ